MFVHWRFGVLILIFIAAWPLMVLAENKQDFAEATIQVEPSWTIKEARFAAEQAALGIMLENVLGVNASSSLLIVDGQGSRLAQVGQRGHVFNKRCEVRGPYTQAKRSVVSARCWGKVKALKTQGPKVAMRLFTVSSAADACPQVVPAERPGEDYERFYSGQRFCVALESATDAWVGIYSRFVKVNSDEAMFTRLFPADASLEAVKLDPGKAVVLPDPQRVSLQAGEDNAFEHILLLSSQEKTPFTFAGKTALSLEQALNHALPFAQFEAFYQEYFDRLRLLGVPIYIEQQSDSGS